MWVPSGAGAVEGVSWGDVLPSGDRTEGGSDALGGREELGGKGGGSGN